MIRYSIISDQGGVIEGHEVKTPTEEIKNAITLKRSVIYSHVTSFEIIVPVGTETAIVYHVRKLHLGFMLRVLSFYCMGWGFWMIAFDGIEEMILYEGLNDIIIAPQNDLLFYSVIVTIGVFSLFTSFFGRYKIVGFNLQAAWWFFLTAFFAHNGTNTAIFIYGSFFVLSLYGAYLTIKND